VTELAAPPTNVDGRPLSRRGLDTRRRLLDAAESIFVELDYHEASIVKITEAAGVAQGTFYLYFRSKQDVFEEVVRDLNRRVRHALTEAASSASNRREAEELGFREFLRFTAENPALYRVIRQAEFVAPDVLREHYDRFVGAYAKRLREAMDAGEIAESDPDLLAFVLAGAAELFGLRLDLWPEDPLSEEQFRELMRIIWRTLGEATPA
jgi:AcrR family transcriptional regulator